MHAAERGDPAERDSEVVDDKARCGRADRGAAAGHPRSAGRAAHEDRAHQVGAGQQLLGRAVEADLALLHEDRPVGDGEGDVEGLLDEQDRRAGFVEPADDPEQLLDDGRRQPERELVDEQQRRRHQQRLRQPDHLLLATGQQACRLVEAFSEHGEQVEYLLRPLGDRGLLVLERPGRSAEVLGHRQAGEHGCAAGHAHHAGGRDRVRRQVRDVAAVEEDGSVAASVHAGDRAQQRRLAGAVGPDEGDDLAALDVEVDAVQHLHAAVRDVDVAADQQRVSSLTRGHSGGVGGLCCPDVALDPGGAGDEDQPADDEERGEEEQPMWQADRQHGPQQERQPDEVDELPRDVGGQPEAADARRHDQGDQGVAAGLSDDLRDDEQLQHRDGHGTGGRNDSTAMTAACTMGAKPRTAMNRPGRSRSR